MTPATNPPGRGAQSAAPERSWPCAAETPTHLFAAEQQRFNKTDRERPPSLGIALSGGGNRSAAFSIGILQALQEKRLLEDVDVISAVSGGSYALSWLLFQPYHEMMRGKEPFNLPKLLAEMFNPSERFQDYLEGHTTLGAIRGFDYKFRVAFAALWDLTAFNFLRLAAAPFSLLDPLGAAVLLNSATVARSEYRTGIQTTYHTPPNYSPEAFFGPSSRGQRAAAWFQNIQQKEVAATPTVTFLAMSEFASDVGLPSFIFNATVFSPRPTDEVPLGRRVFELGPIGYGSDSCGYVTWPDTEGFGPDFLRATTQRDIA